MLRSRLRLALGHCCGARFLFPIPREQVLGVLLDLDPRMGTHDHKDSQEESDVSLGIQTLGSLASRSHNEHSLRERSSRTQLLTAPAGFSRQLSTVVKNEGFGFR